MDTQKKAAVGQIGGSDEIGTNCSILVVFAPIHVRSACDTGAVEDMSWLDALQLSHDLLAILHSDCRRVNVSSLLLQHVVQDAGDPSVATPDEEDLIAIAETTHVVVG
jgi:hypothetical protein